MSDPLADRLRAVGCVFAEDEAAEIRRVHGDDAAAVDAVVAARASGIPLEQVLGVAWFDGLEIAVEPGVFVPRRRAEPLIPAAVAARPHARVVVDLGCGSGAIAAALAARLPRASVHAVDFDEHAITVARRNATRYGFAVHHGDWWSALPVEFRGTVELAVAYLPHVPTHRLSELSGDYRAHEPDKAVAGGSDGLRPLATVAAGMRDWLAPDGVLVTLVAEEQFDAARALADADQLRLVVA